MQLVASCTSVAVSVQLLISFLALIFFKGTVERQFVCKCAERCHLKAAL